MGAKYLSLCRSAVQSMRVLLCRMGFRSQVFAIEAQGGWDALLSAPTHLAGVRTVARSESPLLQNQAAHTTTTPSWC